jgi:hypothetical protein
VGEGRERKGKIEREGETATEGDEEIGKETKTVGDIVGKRKAETEREEEMEESQREMQGEVNREHTALVWLNLLQIVFLSPHTFPSLYTKTISSLCATANLLLSGCVIMMVMVMIVIAMVTRMKLKLMTTMMMIMMMMMIMTMMK